MSDVRQPELRESTSSGDIRKWLKESFEGAEWEDDDSPIDFDDTPLEQLLSAVFDWHDRNLSDALNRLGYSSETIRVFRDDRGELASAVEGPALPLGDKAIIFPAKQHSAVRDPHHMLLIDGFKLLRAARYFAGETMFKNVLRYLQLLEKHWSIFHETRHPTVTGGKGGRASGKARRKKRDEKLDAAARAFGQLVKKPEYTMRDPKKPEIAKAAGLSKSDLRSVSLKKIKARAAELRRIEGSDE